MGYILINGKRAKASARISPGDRITLNLPGGKREVEVLAVPEVQHISRDEAKGLYRELKP